MSYINSTIEDDEAVFNIEKISLRSFYGWFILCGVLQPFSTEVAFLLAGFVILCMFVGHLSTEFGVTSKRVVIRTGLVSRHCEEIPIERIESVQVRQSTLGRLLNYGNIIIGGYGANSITTFAVTNPLQIRKAIMKVTSVRSSEARPILAAQG